MKIFTQWNEREKELTSEREEGEGSWVLDGDRKRINAGEIRRKNAERCRFEWQEWNSLNVKFGRRMKIFEYSLVETKKNCLVTATFNGGSFRSARARSGTWIDTNGLFKFLGPTSSTFMGRACLCGLFLLDQVHLTTKLWWYY